MAQVVLQLELALEQQEARKDVLPNQITNVADETTLPVSTEQPTVASSESIERGKDQSVNTEPPPANKDGRKPKMYKSPRFWVWDALWKKGKVSRNEELVRNSLSGSKLTEYDFATIAAATNQFSYSNKIGKGGFGPVYKGVLPTGQIVAVKRLSQTSRQGIEFKRSILSTSNLQHRNIIKLLGYCIHEEPLLVYEFMANGSLQTHISDEVQRRLLHWDMRFKILMGTVRGIIYLHQDSEMKTIHRDIKLGSILLDIHINPKISSFGLSITLEDDQSEVETNIAGTMGYLAPECYMYMTASVMSDIYSLGIVVLEIVSGRRFRDWMQSNDQTLVEYAWKLWKEGNILHLVDESIEGAFSEEEALRCIQVGLLCTQEDAHQRPNISSVLKMLLGEELHLETQEKVVKAAAYHKVEFRRFVSNSVSDDYSESPPLAIETSQKDDHNVMKNPFNGSAATFEKDNTLSPLLNPLIDSTQDPLTNPFIDNDAMFEDDNINNPNTCSESDAK
ncbi:hypothetical protein RD792_016779 [Penstemon davidsonii]|uniref:Protein kinase domain-containing protein n=1 Tax=Penstemon davidsonii TaxID=160366 RepID=A0ABR0CKQ3_9LAMI|nr:hypothetical protein RD792_016779 [Penstemon davidsonii]